MTVTSAMAIPSSLQRCSDFQDLVCGVLWSGASVSSGSNDAWFPVPLKKKTEQTVNGLLDFVKISFSA